MSSENGKLSPADEQRVITSLFGEDNIMFHTKVSLKQVGSAKFTYQFELTCKLCDHVTTRVGKTNIHLCSGCYREWDRETDTIKKPSNGNRLGRAKRNGKDVLPCDAPQDREAVAKVVRIKPGQHFYCSSTNTLYLCEDE